MTRSPARALRTKILRSSAQPHEPMSAPLQFFRLGRAPEPLGAIVKADAEKIAAKVARRGFCLNC